MTSQDSLVHNSVEKSVYSIGIDTSHTRGQLCLLKDKQLLENIFWEKKGSHSEILNSTFQKTLKKHDLLISDIKKIYCSVGPGSFTGLRVGVNFCKTLAYSSSAELFEINTLEALAYLCQGQNKKIASAIDAQRNALFVSTFDENMKPLSQNQIISILDLKDLITEDFLVSGSGMDRYKDLIDSNVLKRISTEDQWRNPDLSPIILSNEENSFISPIPWTSLKPLYIRLSSPEEKLKGN